MAISVSNYSILGWGFSTKNLILKARQKLSRDQVDQVAALVGLTKKEMAFMLGVTERNLYNQHQGDLSVPLSERLLILENVLRHGLAVFDGQQDTFYEWLHTPLAELATPEVGFAAPAVAYEPRPISEMGTKETAPDLLAAATARRERLARKKTSSTTAQPYPTPLSMLDTITGCKLVDSVFTRIESGVFS